MNSLVSSWSFMIMKIDKKWETEISQWFWEGKRWGRLWLLWWHKTKLFLIRVSPTKPRITSFPVFKNPNHHELVKLLENSPVFVVGTCFFGRIEASRFPWWSFGTLFRRRLFECCCNVYLPNVVDQVIRGKYRKVQTYDCRFRRCKKFQSHRWSHTSN